MYSAIILAGGTGSRMHQSVPKQFLALAGKPMILHTLERLERIDEIDEIIVPCYPQYKELLRVNIDAYMLKKPYKIVDGGDTRQQSAYLGVLEARNEDILIHEAARPFVTTREFTALLEDKAENATYGLDIPFTVSVRTGDSITGLLERDRLVNIQLPQKFKRTPLLEAYERAERDGLVFTEDTSLLYYYSRTPVKVLEGTPNNIKVTNSLDMAAGEIIYKEYIVGRD